MSLRRTCAAVTGTALLFTGLSSVAALAVPTTLNVAPIATVTGVAPGEVQYGLARDAQGYSYVATDDAIAIYAPGTIGAVTPARVITGPATGLAGPGHLAVDPAGFLHVPNYDGSSITVYAPGANGNVAPVRTIVGAATLLDHPAAVAFGPDGSAYVSDFDIAGVLVFAATANGNAAPVRTVTNAALDDGLEDIAVDRTGAIYGSEYDADAIRVFAPGASGASPIAKSIVGLTTLIDGPGEIATDSSNNLYVASYDSENVTVFDASASGNAEPRSVLAGATTSLDGDWTLAVDANRNVTVGNYANGALLTYAPLVPRTIATAVPALAVSGADKALTRTVTWGTVVDDGGAAVSGYKVVVKNGATTTLTRTVAARSIQLDRTGLGSGAHTVTITPINQVGAGAAASKTFNVTKIAPTNVRSLKISGSKKSAKRTVSWKAPAWTGGASITTYRVVVKKGSKTVLTKTVTGSKRKVTLKKSALKNGKLSVVVQAKNSAGYGAKATKKISVKK